MQREIGWFGFVPVLVLALLAGVAPALAAGDAQAKKKEETPAATPASAADDEKWEVGAYAVFSHHDVASTIKNTFGPGGRVGYRFTKVHEVELQYDRGSGDSTTLPGATIDVTTISVNYLRNYSPKGHDHIKPFLIFGVGVIKVEDGTDSMSTDLLRAGGGMRFLAGHHFAVRFDITGLSWYGDSRVTALTRLYTFDAGLGVSFLFGGTK